MTSGTSLIFDTHSRSLFFLHTLYTLTTHNPMSPQSLNTATTVTQRSLAEQENTRISFYPQAFDYVPLQTQSIALRRLDSFCDDPVVISDFPIYSSLAEHLTI